MLAPVLRLLAIYLCVGLAVFGFFKRDVLMGMFQGDKADTSHTAAPAVPAAVASSPAPGATAPEPATHAASPVQPAATPVFAPLPDPVAPTGVPAASPATAPVQLQPVAQDFESQRNAARQAYWAGDKDGAIAAYKALLAQTPDDGALNGELGNIYYVTNQRDQAAIYFERAGQAALAAGNQAETSMLIGILRGLDPAAAQRLSDARQGVGQ